MTIEDENIDHMVRLIRYEPLENFFTRHPSLDEYKDLLRSSQSDSVHETHCKGQVLNKTEARGEKSQENAKINQNDEVEAWEDDVFYYESDEKELSVRYKIRHVKYISVYISRLCHYYDGWLNADELLFVIE